MQTHQRTKKTSAISALALEFRVSERRIRTMLQGVGINPSSLQRDDESQAFYREVVASRLNIFTSYGSGDEEYLQTLDEQIRVFDEIYVDTAPIIQKDWFLHFVADSKDILKRRKKRLIIEKTMEELYGLKQPKRQSASGDNPPDLIRSLASSDRPARRHRQVESPTTIWWSSSNRRQSQSHVDHSGSGLERRIVHQPPNLGRNVKK